LRDQEGFSLEDIQKELTETIETNGLKALISGRAKTPFSIWRKMQRKQIHLEQFLDIMAFRVIVETIPQCYQALGILHSAYSLVPGRFKDYISTPKQNHYQSLHTTILGPFGRRIEVQIRTEAMHQIAEFGIASHWQYKQGKKNKDINLEAQNYHWLRGLLEILDNASNPEEFLEHTKLEMFQDQVFCFTPKGKLVSLPRGGTPIDFAYAVHSEIGNHCVGSKINGRLMSLRTPLENGDQIEIVTSDTQTPSPVWEQFAITGKARSSIRRFVRTQQRAQFVQLGKTILQKATKQYHLQFPGKQEMVIGGVKCESLEDLQAFLGQGRLTLQEILMHFLPEKETQPLQLEASAQSYLPSPSQGTQASRGISIEGLIPGMAIHFARCCHPIPGDQITGVMIAGKGITIHTSDCENLSFFNEDPSRLLDVFWSDQLTGEPYTARIYLSLLNKPGAFAALSALIAEAGANILNLKIQYRNVEFYEMFVDLEVENRQQVEEIIASLRISSWILSVERQTHDA